MERTPKRTANKTKRNSNIGSNSARNSSNRNKASRNKLHRKSDNRNAERKTNSHKSKSMTGDQAFPGQTVKITIKRIGINGEGVGYYRKKAVFIPGALPDEIVRAIITDVYPNYLKAKLIKVEKKSPDRITPPCPVYEQCGGCSCNI